MRFFVTCIAFCLAIFNSSAQFLQTSKDSVNFGNVTTGQVDSMLVTLTAPVSAFITVWDINIYHKDFSVGADTAFILSNGQTHNLWIRFKPVHNILHNTELVIRTEGWRNDTLFLYDHAINVLGRGVYPDTYYSSTQDLSEEALKTALNTKLAQGYVTLGYNTARDKMFMEIDNWKVNGRGASVNKAECIYTGRIVAGYTSRTDAQNAPNNFNTEHTWPQSMFGSADPMVSDLHHLFITDNTANSQRSNDPFAMVSSPTWSNGGSKSNGSSFEPRDAQKGATARAMLYFITRHGNQGNFMTAQQENTLRQWALQFPPDSVARKRNNDIFTYQKNRNPYVDHPELLERITTLSATSVAPSKRVLEVSENSFYWIKSINPNVALLNIQLTATGNTDISISNVALKQNTFSLQSFPATVKVGESGAIQLRINNLLVNTWYTDTLTFNTSDPLKPAVQIPIRLRKEPGSVEEINTRKVQVSPNPATSEVKVELLAGEAVESVMLTNPVGHKFSFVGNNRPVIVLNLSELPAGVYFVSVKSAAGVYTSKLLLKP